MEVTEQQWVGRAEDGEPATVGRWDGGRTSEIGDPSLSFSTDGVDLA